MLGRSTSSCVRCFPCLVRLDDLRDRFSVRSQVGQSCEMGISVRGQIGAPARVALQRVALPRGLGCICALRNALVTRRLCFKTTMKPMVVEFKIKSDFVSCRVCLRSTFRFRSQACRTRTHLRRAGAYRVCRLPPPRVSCLSGMATRNPIVEELRIMFNFES